MKHIFSAVLVAVSAFCLQQAAGGSDWVYFGCVLALMSVNTTIWHAAEWLAERKAA